MNENGVPQENKPVSSKKPVITPAQEKGADFSEASKVTDNKIHQSSNSYEKRTFYLQLLGLIIAIIGGFLVYDQIMEGNRIAEYNSLENRASELEKMSIEHPELLCIYKYPLEKKENQYCSGILKTRDGYFKLYEYTQQIIFLIGDVSHYSIDHHDAMIEDYEHWIDMLKVDNEHIFSHVMNDILKYDSANKTKSKYPTFDFLFKVEARTIETDNARFLNKFGDIRFK
jgi:hypothetical protein